MLDIELIRERPQQVKDALQTVNADPACVDTVFALDVQRREVLTRVETLRAERNRVSKEIGRSSDQDERQTAYRTNARGGRTRF